MIQIESLPMPPEEMDFVKCWEELQKWKQEYLRQEEERINRVMKKATSKESNYSSLWSSLEQFRLDIARGLNNE
jgi:hypothetical protein